MLVFITCNVRVDKSYKCKVKSLGGALVLKSPSVVYPPIDELFFSARSEWGWFGNLAALS